MNYACIAGHMVPADQPAAALRMLTLQMAGDVSTEAQRQGGVAGRAERSEDSLRLLSLLRRRGGQAA